MTANSAQPKAESDQPAWLSVRCPACRAHPGWGCVNRDGWFRSKPHQSRVEAVATSPATTASDDRG